MRAIQYGFLLFWLGLAGSAVADPGAEVARGDAGFVRWYLYAESPGLVLGESALGVLLEAPSGGVELEPRLQLELRAPDGSTQTRLASRGFSDNRLLQGAPFFFHQTGTWILRMQPVGHGSRDLFQAHLEIHEGPGIWWQAWPWLVLPLVVGWVAWTTRSRKGVAPGTSRRSRGP